MGEDCAHDIQAVHNYDNEVSLWMIKSTNARNGNWINLMIINSSNVYMTLYICIDDSNIFTRDSSISNAVNQWLTMCAAVGGNVDKYGVNLTIQYSIKVRSFISCVEYVLELEINFHISIG